jgi:hypothetical protein
LILLPSKPHHIVRFGPKIVKNARINFGFASYSGYVDRDGLPHGIGEIVLRKPGYPRGGTYIGEFRNGMKTGLGSIIYLDGEPYTGQWVRDELTGYGSQMDSKGRKYRGQFFSSLPDGLGEIVIEDCVIYLGEQRNGLNHGKCLIFEPGTCESVDYNYGILLSKETGLLVACFFESLIYHRLIDSAEAHRRSHS